MSKQKNRDELNIHKSAAMTKMEQLVTELIESEDPVLMGKADKLCYWLEDWSKFLAFEPQFQPMKLRRYKRGEIIKVHLGFNIGSEEGGLHYAVVLDKNNAKSSPVITVVPLTSVKPNTDVESLKGGRVFLGNELFTCLSAKITASSQHLSGTIKLIKDQLISGNANSEELNANLKAMIAENSSLEKMRKEIAKMKKGSIALTSQITTISKIRVYDPKSDYDILSGIKLSNEKLDLIDNEIKKNYLK